jgi:glycosyltransferase involved in cell wall biosynthesis
MDLSIVVPLYNEQDSVRPLYNALSAALRSFKGKFEYIFVDDGSSDSTFEIAREIAEEDKRLRVVKFRTNYGQTPAMAAGIDIASGKYIVTMDGDLQNDPEDILRLTKELDAGFDIAVGWRFDRQDKLISRKIPSRIANWIIGRVTAVPINDSGCSLKAFRADVIKHVPLYSEMHRFIPVMASMAGPKLAEVKVRHHARKFGESKYGLSRVYKVILDLLSIKMVSGFAERPMKWFAILSIPFFFASIVILVWQTKALLFDSGGSLPLSGAGVFFGMLGVFLLFSGGFGELVSRTGRVNMTGPRLSTATIVVGEYRGRQFDRDHSREVGYGE